MREVIKVFLRLKATEIWEVICLVPEVFKESILPGLAAIGAIAALCIAFFLICHGLGWLAVAIMHWPIDGTVGYGVYGFFILVGLAVPATVGFGLFVTFSWLRSNWRLAKTIVARRQR